MVTYRRSQPFAKETVLFNGFRFSPCPLKGRFTRGRLVQRRSTGPSRRWGWGLLFLALWLPVYAQPEDPDTGGDCVTQLDECREALKVDDEYINKLQRLGRECESSTPPETPCFASAPACDCEANRRELERLQGERDQLAAELKEVAARQEPPPYTPAEPMDCSSVEERCRQQIDGFKERLAQATLQRDRLSDRIQQVQEQSLADERATKDAIRLLRKILENDLRRRSGQTLCSDAAQVEIVRDTGGELAIEIQARLPDAEAVHRLRADYGDLGPAFHLHAEIGGTDGLCPFPLTDEWSLLIPRGGGLQTVPEPIGERRPDYRYPEDREECIEAGRQVAQTDPIKDWLNASPNHQLSIWYRKRQGFGVCILQDGYWRTPRWLATGRTAFLIYRPQGFRSESNR